LLLILPVVVERRLDSVQVEFRILSVLVWSSLALYCRETENGILFVQ
jgi:hypothetical protein